MKVLPILISYPRSGANFTSCTLELFFQRPKLRKGPHSLLSAEVRKLDPWWFHDHDRFSKLQLPHSRVAYLVRDPIDVIFSLVTAEHGKVTQELVEREIGWLAKHHAKYLDGSFPVVSYHDLTGDNCVGAFRRLVEFIQPRSAFDKQKLLKAKGRVKRGEIIKRTTDPRYFNKRMLTDEYAIKRDKYRQTYGDQVREALYTERLCSVLNLDSSA